MARFKLDEIDHKILDMLIENTRMPFTDIAKALDISAGTVRIISGKYNILCKIRAKDTKHAKEIIFQIDDIEGVYRTESMISMEESISDKKRLLHTVFKEL